MKSLLAIAYFAFAMNVASAQLEYEVEVQVVDLQVSVIDSKGNFEWSSRKF